VLLTPFTPSPRSSPFRGDPGRDTTTSMSCTSRRMSSEIYSWSWKALSSKAGTADFLLGKRWRFVSHAEVVEQHASTTLESYFSAFGSLLPCELTPLSTHSAPLAPKFLIGIVNNEEEVSNKKVDTHCISSSWPTNGTSYGTGREPASPRYAVLSEAWVG
jgi:hypothetical protein